MRRLLAASLILVLACVNAGTRAKNKPKTRMLIAGVPMHRSIEYWVFVQAGAMRAAKDLDVDLIWQGPFKGNDRQGQRQICDSMILRGANAMVLAPLDSKVLRASAQDAVRTGIPVVIIDSALEYDEQSSFIATDNLAAGKLGGHHLANLLGGKGKVAVLRGVEGTASTDAREKGFLEAMKDYPGIEVVSSNQRGGANVETARKASENILAPLRNADGSIKLDGVFCSMESLTLGMLLALQDGGLAGKVKLVGFDFSKPLIEAVEDGRLSALVAQDPVKLGYLGVQKAVAVARGEPVDKWIEVKPTLVTKDNVNDPAVRKQIEPDLSIINGKCE